jgi:hypothetical protein
MFYNLKELEEKIKELKDTGRQKISLEDLFFNIGFDLMDFNKFWIKDVKHRIRYNKSL